MKLKILNSNSTGNGYILEGENTALLLECGVPFKDILEGLNFKIKQVAACLITHEHGDHSRSVKEVLENGIGVIASRGTKEALNMDPDESYNMKHGSKFEIQGFKVISFAVNHDAKEPLGFIIDHESSGKILFVTDTNLLKYKFEGSFDHIILEANYCEYLAEKWRESMKGNAEIIEKRRLRNHMSFQTAKLTISKMDLSKTKNIVLIHLSDGLSDEKRFKEELENEFGVPVTVAAPDIVINFNKEPF